MNRPQPRTYVTTDSRGRKWTTTDTLHEVNVELDGKTLKLLGTPIELNGRQMYLCGDEWELKCAQTRVVCDGKVIAEGVTEDALSMALQKLKA